MPAYFTERQKQATRNACEIAELEIIKIINEPTAASLAYGFGKCHYKNELVHLLGKKITFDENINQKVNITENNNENNKKETQNILVFDLGGGTLDVTLLELEEDDITIKSHCGKMHLGGEDFDNILVDYCIAQFKNQFGIDLNKEEYVKQRLRLKEHCEKAKKNLSFKFETIIEVESLINDKDLYLNLTRAKFEELCKDKFNLCLEPIIEILNKTGTNKKDIDEILLVGGSSNIPKIQEILSEFFDKKKLNNKLNLDEAVAYGATIEAAIQMGQYNQDISLVDVCPFSLGLAVDNKQNKKDLLMKKIINKGTKLPCKVVVMFQPACDFSTSVRIQIFEGENKYVKDNYPLGSFKIFNLPKKLKKDIYIEVIFELDINSILTVSAKVKDTDCKNSIIIKNDKGGLTDSEKEQAKEKQQNEVIGKDLADLIKSEKKYKREIYNYINIINSSNERNEQYLILIKLQNTIENFIDSFKKDNYNNDTFMHKIYKYLTILFNVYSLLLNFGSLLSSEEKENIILKIKNYFEFFKTENINFCEHLVKIFINNEDEIFGEFCIIIMGYYSQKGTELFFKKNENKYSKHFLEEVLSINEKYSIQDRIKNKIELEQKLLDILDNCKELINILKAESIKKNCKMFSEEYLISEEDFTNQDEIIELLDKCKEALYYLKNPKYEIDKLLKAIYLGNIIKIEYNIFHSNNYDILLKMIRDCIDLKSEYSENKNNLTPAGPYSGNDRIYYLPNEESNSNNIIVYNPYQKSNNNSNPYKDHKNIQELSSNSKGNNPESQVQVQSDVNNKPNPNIQIKPRLKWFEEIEQIKKEIEEKQKKAIENPKEEENIIKERLKDIINEINNKFKEGKISFFFYILRNHKPNGLDKNFIFNNEKDLEEAYFSHKTKFMKKLRKFYNPLRYKGDKEEEQKMYCIMNEIMMKLNTFE